MIWLMWMLEIEAGSPSLQPQPVLFNDTEIQSLRSAVCFLKMALVQESVSLSLYQWLGLSHPHTLGSLSLPMCFLQRHWDLRCSCLGLVWFSEVLPCTACYTYVTPGPQGLAIVSEVKTNQEPGRTMPKRSAYNIRL